VSTQITLHDAEWHPPLVWLEQPVLTRGAMTNLGPTHAERTFWQILPRRGWSGGPDPGQILPRQGGALPGLPRRGGPEDRAVVGFVSLLNAKRS
jgi:hypothetical protein